MALLSLSSGRRPLPPSSSSSAITSTRDFKDMKQERNRHMREKNNRDQMNRCLKVFWDMIPHKFDSQIFSRRSQITQEYSDSYAVHSFSALHSQWCHKPAETNRPFVDGVRHSISGFVSHSHGSSQTVRAILEDYWPSRSIALPPVSTRYRRDSFMLIRTCLCLRAMVDLQASFSLIIDLLVLFEHT